MAMNLERLDFSLGQTSFEEISTSLFWFSKQSQKLIKNCFKKTFNGTSFPFKPGMAMKLAPSDSFLRLIFLGPRNVYFTVVVLKGISKNN
jgi:hypothetical protein